MADLYDEKAAARIVGVTPRTLRRWRKAGMVAHYATPTGRVRYRLEDLVEACRFARVSANGRECPTLAACVPMPEAAEPAISGA